MKRSDFVLLVFAVLCGDAVARTIILLTQDVKELWARKGVEFAPNISGQYAAKIRDEHDKIAVVIKAADIKANI